MLLDALDFALLCRSSLARSEIVGLFDGLNDERGVASCESAR